MQLFKTTTKEHYNKYAQLLEKTGLKFNPNFLILPKDTLTLAFQEDQHLNNIPLKQWDILAIQFISNTGNRYHLSLAEGVCLFKHIAIYHIIGAQPQFKEE